VKKSAQFITPAEAMFYGVVAGCAATALLSVLTRIPGIRQAAEQSNLKYRLNSEEDSDPTLPLSPAEALVQTTGPGPEGAAGLFAAKIASGMFGRDLAKHTRGWGKLVHFCYGSFWGMVYGILQAKQARRPRIAGTAHGLFVWGVGPLFLVPAMKLMPPPAKAPPTVIGIGLAGHLIYGVTVATLFNRLTQVGAGHERAGS
jgi:hypothetical protein